MKNVRPADELELARLMGTGVVSVAARIISDMFEGGHTVAVVDYEVKDRNEEWGIEGQANLVREDVSEATKKPVYMRVTKVRDGFWSAYYSLDSELIRPHSKR